MSFFGNGGSGGSGGTVVMPDLTGVVKKVNMREPDAEGNVFTDFMILENAPAINIPPSEYPNGNSEFVEKANSSEWVNMLEEEAAPIYSRAKFAALASTPEEDEGRVFVRTHIDKTNGVYLQEIDITENGFFEAAFYRSSLDGITWGEVKRVSRLKTINGITPDESDNVEIPVAAWSSF